MRRTFHVLTGSVLAAALAAGVAAWWSSSGEDPGSGPVAGLGTVAAGTPVPGRPGARAGAAGGWADPGRPTEARAAGAALTPGRTASAALGGVPEAAARVLAEIRARDTGQLAVSEEDGRFLRVLAAASGSRRALEIGGASGYSAIWIALGLRETGGRLVTIEYDPGRAREAAANLRRAGLDDIVRVVEGDAFVQVPSLEGRFDFVFLDAWKKDYKRFYDLVEPRLEPGGLLVAHNVVNKRGELEDFLAAVEANPRLLTTIVRPSGEGMSVSVRRR
jgi:predicted O-methyltransferase YrrM